VTRKGRQKDENTLRPPHRSLKATIKRSNSDLRFEKEDKKEEVSEDITSPGLQSGKRHQNESIAALTRESLHVEMSPAIKIRAKHYNFKNHELDHYSGSKDIRVRTSAKESSGSHI